MGDGVFDGDADWEQSVVRQEAGGCLPRVTVGLAGRGGWWAAGEKKGEDFFCIGAARKPRVSFSIWRVAADRSRTRVQRGSASTRHLRKIAALFSRNSPAPMTKEILCSTSCGRRAEEGEKGSGFGVQEGTEGVARGDCRCARWAHWFGGERNSLCARRAQLQFGGETPPVPCEWRIVFRLRRLR